MITREVLKYDLVCLHHLETKVVFHEAQRICVKILSFDKTSRRLQINNFQRLSVYWCSSLPSQQSLYVIYDEESNVSQGDVSENMMSVKSGPQIEEFSPVIVQAEFGYNFLSVTSFSTSRKVDQFLMMDSS